jgi:hypothetical protein
MPKRAVALVLTLLLTLTGCTVKKVQKLPAASIAATLPENQSVVGVTTMKGEDVAFDAPGALIKDGKLTGKVKKTVYELPIDQAQRLWIQTKEISTARTVGLVAGIGVVVAVVAVAAVLSHDTKAAAPTTSMQQSCPFIYSWDGTRYVFDAEPYGGAIARGLEKDDYSELGQLREVDGRYKLKITNEVDETQMTNLTELWVVDHPNGTRVVPDVLGKLHTVSEPQELLSASDAEGHDLLPWLRSTDHKIWEPPSTPDAKGNLEGDIEMSFPKPPDAKQVKLIANAGTALWGSYMIKQMVALRGRDVGKFYAAVNHSASARKALADWELREQLYQLKVYVEEPTGWEVRGVLPGTGPFITKDRILPLDVSHVKGDRLHIRIHPPAGFWALNSFAVDYSTDRAISVQTLKPATAIDPDGKSVLPQLVSADNRYLEMPNIGDTADLTFVAPARRDGSERTVVLHTRGYYKLHLPHAGDPDKKMLAAFEKVPGSAAQFAASQYAQWQLAHVQVP